MPDRADVFRHKRSLRLLAIFAVAGLVISVSVSWWLAGQLVAPAPRSIDEIPVGLNVEPVSIRSGSGSTLRGWYGRGASDLGTVVLLHAIRGSRLQMVDRARLLTRNGYSVLLIDLQAHGESSGKRITAGHLERLDAKAAVQFAHQRKPGQPVAVIGVSLGGAATLLASPLNIDAAVLESVYPTISEAVGNRFQMRIGRLSPIPTQLLLLQLESRLGINRAQLRPIDHIGRIGCPVLVMAGSSDRHTTPSETRSLFESASEPKQLAIFEGASHVDLCRYDPKQYAELVLSFLDGHLSSRRGHAGE